MKYREEELKFRRVGSEPGGVIQEYQMRNRKLRRQIRNI